MSFNSIFFLFTVLPIFLIIYIITPEQGKKYTLLVLSFLAYFWVEPLYSVLLVVLACYLYYLNLQMMKAKHRKKTLLFIELLSIILFLLGYFKYYQFILNTFSISTLSIRLLAVPVGISFISFSMISYLIDSYRNKIKQFSLFDYLLYLFYFPKMIMGPIMRYHNFHEQLTHCHMKLETAKQGVCRFVIGLSKKVLLANTFAQLFQLISQQEQIGMISAWIGALAFTFQIYFDFSGYSDMAIGLSHIFGITLPENFHYPYIADSIKSFWKRWHITLSTWFKDYVYIPLGGSKCSFNRVILNTFIVWVLTGLWHGASWNFVLWGIYYFILLILERYVLYDFLNRLNQIQRMMITFILVMIGWVLFAFVDIHEMFAYLKAMFGFNGFIDTSSFWYFKNYILYFFCGFIFATPLLPNLYQEHHDTKLMIFHDVIILGLFIICISALISDAFQPFLYAQF